MPQYLLNHANPHFPVLIFYVDNFIYVCLWLHPRTEYYFSDVTSNCIIFLKWIIVINIYVYIWHSLK